MRPASVRGAGWDLAAAGLARALLWLAVPVLVLQVFDRAIPGARADDLLLLGFAVAAALVLRAGLDLATAAMTESLNQARRRAALWSAITNLLSPDAKGAADAPPLIDALAPPASGTLILSGLPVLVAALVYVAGVMAVPAVAIALAAALTAYLISRGGNTPNNGAASSGNAFADRILDAIWTVKAMGAENLVLRHAEIAARADMMSGRRQIQPLLSIDRAEALFDRAGLVLVVLTGTVLCLNGLITAGQLVAGVLVAGVVVRDAFRGTAALVRTRASGPAAPVSGSASVPASEPLPRITGNLMLNRVTFDEPASDLRPMSRMLFDRVRIEVEVGEAVLVTGGDSQAQTYLLRLMAGLDRPLSGTVSVDGYDLAGFRPDSVRRQIAFVPPLGDVLPGSLLENLTAFDPGRAADALGAARLTGLDVKAACLADGFDTRLQGGAAGFPAGFRQHLAITRALALKPKILLLDKATENLDSQDLRSFAEVLERLKGRVTIVFASTQAGLRAMADREIDLDALKPAPEIGTADDDADDGGPSGPPDGAG